MFIRASAGSNCGLREPGTGADGDTPGQAVGFPTAEEEMEEASTASPAGLARLMQGKAGDEGRV
jgi:hypothetical protein